MENIDLIADENMRAYAAQAAAFRLPRWEQIPSLGLYMDQVVTVIEGALAPLLDFGGEAFITPAMINNYVKLGIIRKPEKKKYSREQIAGLLVITILKQSLAIGDIRLGMDSVTGSGDSQAAYDNVCGYVEGALGTVAAGLLAPENAAQVEFRFVHGDVGITMAACSFASKLFSSKMVSVIRQHRQTDEHNS